MNLTDMYQSSPDSIKLIWVLAPWVTIYAVARVWVRSKATPLQPLPETNLIGDRMIREVQMLEGDG